MHHLESRLNKMMPSFLVCIGLLVLVVNFTQGFRPVYVPRLLQQGNQQRLQGIQRQLPRLRPLKQLPALQAKPRIGDTVPAYVDDLGGPFEDDPQIFFKVSHFL